MTTALQPMKPAQLAIVLVCSAAFAGAVANHSGLLRGVIAGGCIFLVSLGCVLVWPLATRGTASRPEPIRDDRDA
jgi:hypothetical protein